jgi:hypothetical protein
MFNFVRRVGRTHSGRRSISCLLASENVGNFHLNNSKRSNGFTLYSVGLFPKFLLLGILQPSLGTGEYSPALLPCDIKN